jgi:hypothetical protein
MTQSTYRKPMIGEPAAEGTQTASQDPLSTAPVLTKPHREPEGAAAAGTGYPQWLKRGVGDSSTGYPSMNGTTQISGCQGTYGSIM